MQNAFGAVIFDSFDFNLAKLRELTSATTFSRSPFTETKRLQGVTSDDCEYTDQIREVEARLNTLASERGVSGDLNGAALARQDESFFESLLTPEAVNAFSRFRSAGAL